GLAGLGDPLGGGRGGAAVQAGDGHHSGLAGHARLDGVVGAGGLVAHVDRAGDRQGAARLALLAPADPVVRPAGTGVDGEDDDGLAVDVAVELLAELLGLRLAGALEVLADEAHLLGVGVVGVEGDERYAGLVGLA